jgi:hypothetical protein
MAEPFAVPNEVEGVLGTEFVLGTDTSVKLSAIGLFDTGGGHVRVQTTDGSHWALVTYTGVTTNDLTGATQVGLSGKLYSTGDGTYTFPVGSYVYCVCMGEDVSKRIMGPASATSGHFFKANGTSGKLASASAITAAELPAQQVKKYLRGTVSKPKDFYDNVDAHICIWPATDAAITITKIQITCDADPTTELDIDLMWADAFIGLGNAAVIDVCDTTAGVVTITSSFDDATVASGKCILWRMGAAPDALTTQFSFVIEYTYD